MRKLIISIIVIIFLAITVNAQEDTVRIAIIDSGISASVLPNASIEKGENYVFPDRDTNDTYNHGTAIASLIVGKPDRELEGAYPDAVLVPLVYCEVSNGNLVMGSAEMLAQCIYDAVDKFSCRVINISAGLLKDTPELRSACEYAEENGAVIVAAVGNDNQTSSEKLYYPAAYDTVIGVGALNASSNYAADFSQRNKSVALLADGVNLRVARASGTMTNVSGTSYACAFVTAAAARILEINPQLTPSDVRDILYRSASDMYISGYDIDSGWGRLDTEAAIELAMNYIKQIFIDVPDDHFAAKAVKWAAESNVASGYTDTSFNPDDVCTRAQAVTFLWRAAGCPEPASTDCKFEDIASDQYYYKAVLWAHENSIAAGTSDVTFFPDLSITRAQAVTLLWRASGKIVQNMYNPFTDVCSDDYYSEAVLWAVSKGITNGTSKTLFEPEGICTRAQIVTFLYRYFVR